MVKPIKKGDDIYIVIMRRWGRYDTHAYVHGVYRKKYEAQQAGKGETEWRGGKYKADILEMALDIDAEVKCKCIQRASDQ